MAKGGIPLDEWSGSNATKELHETVKKIEEANVRLQRWMLGVKAPPSFFPLLDRKGVEALPASGARVGGKPESILLNQGAMLTAVSRYASESAANFRAEIATSLRDLNYDANRHVSLRAEIEKLRALKHIRVN
jgi:hypothetical protein